MTRGEIHLIDFGAPRGSEPSGRRPALIIQNDVGNRVSATTIVATISASGVDRVYPVEVLIRPPEGGIERPSKIDLALLLTVDRSRSVQTLGEVSAETMQRVNRALKISLALQNAD